MPTMPGIPSFMSAEKPVRELVRDMDDETRRTRLHDTSSSGPPKPSTDLKPVKLLEQCGANTERCAYVKPGRSHLRCKQDAMPGCLMCERHQNKVAKPTAKRYDSISQQEIDSAAAPTAHYDLYARQGGVHAEDAYTQMTGNQQMYGVFDAPEDDAEL